MTFIIAHRGASFDAPENTLAAFALAWQQQADGIEGDYCFTRDHQVVCIHDDNTRRTGGKDLSIAQATWEQLREVEVGSWKDKKYSGEPIPSITQVLDALPSGKWCVIELKTGPEIVPLVKAALYQSRVELDRILIIAFDQTTIAESKRQLPMVKAHWLVDYHFDAAAGWSPSASAIAQVVKQCKADGIGSQALRDVVTPTFVAQLRESGVGEFHLWTVDDPDDARYYCQLGAWGVTTNRPGLIRQSLAMS